MGYTLYGYGGVDISATDSIGNRWMKFREL